MKTFIALLMLFVISRGESAAQSFVISGEMRHTTIEGGCWYLNGNDGKHYELYGDSALIAHLRVEGTRATLRVQRMKGAASVCMVGEIVTVLQRIDSVRYNQDQLIAPMDLRGKMQLSNGKWYLKTATGLYDFQTPPSTKYRRSGAKFRQHVRVLINSSGAHSDLKGTIVTPAIPKKKSNARPEMPADNR